MPLRSEQAEGVIVDILDASDTKAPTKPITRHLSPDYFIEPAMIELGRWIADYYFCSPGEALAAISMIGLNDVGAKTRAPLEPRASRKLAGADARDRGPMAPRRPRATAR